MAPPKPYKSRILGGSSKTAGVRADVRVADKRMAGNDPDRFASGIMSKYGFARGNYLGRLSLVFKQQRELVRQIMRGAKSSDVMTAQWLIRLQQLQQAMPETPRERKIVSETTRLVERIIVEKETTRTGDGRSVGQSAHIPDSKPTGHASEERSDAPKSRRSGRSGDEKTDRSERGGDNRAKTTKSRNSRKSADQAGTDPSSPDGKPKRKRKANQEAVNNHTKADNPATEIAPPSRAELHTGKAVVIIRAKPFAGGSMFMHLEAADPKRDRGMRTGHGVKSATAQIVVRHTTDGNPGSQRTRAEHLVHRGAKSVFLQPFDRIYRSTRNRTYAESVIDKYVRAIAPISHNPLTRNESVQLRGTPRLDRNSAQAKQANREHNEGYSAETVRPMDRDSGNPAMESRFPSNRDADSIRLPYKHRDPARIGVLPEVRARAAEKPLATAVAMSPAGIFGWGHSTGDVIQRHLRIPTGISVSRTMERDSSPQLGAGLVIRRRAPGNMLSISGARLLDPFGQDFELGTAGHSILRHIFTSRRFPLSSRDTEIRNKRASSATGWIERYTGEEEPTGRTITRYPNGMAVPAKPNTRMSGHSNAIAANSRIIPASGDSSGLPRGHNSKSDQAVLLRSAFPGNVSLISLGRGRILPGGVVANGAAPAIRFLFAGGVPFTHESARSREYGAAMHRAGRATADRKGIAKHAAVIRKKQMSEREEYYEPFGTVYRVRNAGDRKGAASFSARSEESISTRRTNTPPALTESGKAAIGRPSVDSGSPTARSLRAPANETIAGRANTAIRSVERSAAALLRHIPLHRMSGIQRLLHDPTVMANTDATRMSPVAGNWSMFPERNDIYMSNGERFQIGRSYRKRFEDGSADFVEGEAIKASQRQMIDYDDGKPAALPYSSIDGSTKKRISLIPGHKAVIRRAPIGTTGSAYEAALLQQRTPATPAAAYPMNKSVIRRLRPESGVARLGDIRYEFRTAYRRASTGKLPVSTPILRRTSADRGSNGLVPSARSLLMRLRPDAASSLIRNTSPYLQPNFAGTPLPMRKKAERSRFVSKTAWSSGVARVFRTSDHRDDGVGPVQAHMLRMPSRPAVLLPVMPVGSINRPQTDRHRLLYGNNGGADGMVDKRNTIWKHAFDTDMGVRSARLFIQNIPNRHAAGRSSPDAAAIDRTNARLKVPRPPTNQSLEDRLVPMPVGERASGRIASGPSHEAALGFMTKRSLRGRQGPDAGPIGPEPGVQSDKSGTVRRHPLYGSGGADGTGSYIGLQSVRQSGVIHRRNEYGASLASSYGQYAKIIRAAVDSPGAMDWSRSGFPLTESGEGRQRRSALLISAPDGRRSSGTIRRKASELNVLANRMLTSSRIPAADDPATDFMISRSDVRHIFSQYRKQSSSGRGGPGALVNRLSAYGNGSGETAVGRMLPIRRRAVPTANGSALSGKDGMTPFVVGSATHRRPSSGARQDMERRTRPGSGTERTLFRYRSHFTELTDRIRSAVPFESGIAREGALAARNGGDNARMVPRGRNETAMVIPALSARSVGMAGENLAFPHRSREAAADGTERVQRIWTGSDANVRTSIIRNVNRFTSSAHTVRESYRAWYNYYADKPGMTRKESAEKRRPDRTHPSTATELRLVRTAMNPGARAAGTLRTTKPGERSPLWSERRGIPQQRPMAISSAPENVLRMNQSDARHTDPMLQLEHKLKAIVPGALGSDPADLDYRRQMKPASPSEPSPAAEPVPPQVDMAELQEMVKRLPQFDIKKIVDRVYREIERKIRFDRQTRGL